MSTKFHTDFVQDLISVGDANFAGRVLRKVFDGGGRFIEQAKDDHRYKGIEDAWIRYVSKGLRVIYVKNSKGVTLYRAGEHSVEDNLTAPSTLEGYELVVDPIRAAMDAAVGNRPLQAAEADEDFIDVGNRASRLLYNHIDRFLYGNLLGRRFLPHKDVYLVSPFLSFDLLRPTHFFGQMLNDLVEGGASIWLVTTPPSRRRDIAEFEELSRRNINVFFNPDLHAKVYAFVLNRDQLKPEQQGAKDFVALGSANLTRSGINPDGLLARRRQFELSYQAAPEDWAEIEAFLLHVTGLSVGLDVVRSNLLATGRSVS